MRKAADERPCEAKVSQLSPELVQDSEWLSDYHAGIWRCGHWAKQSNPSFRIKETQERHEVKEDSPEYMIEYVF